MATILDTAKGFAQRALAGVSLGHRIRIQSMRTPGPRPNRPAALPEVQLTDARRKLTVTIKVPGATSHNTCVCWDEEIHTLAVRVELAPESGDSGTISDWYVEVPLPVDVDPLRGTCTLDGDTLRLQAPHIDTPTGMLLPLPVEWKSVRVPTAEACVA